MFVCLQVEAKQFRQSHRVALRSLPTFILRNRSMEPLSEILSKIEFNVAHAKQTGSEWGKGGELLQKYLECLKKVLGR